MLFHADKVYVFIHC